MIIQVDTRQKKNHHKEKDKWFKEHNVKTISSKLLVGDYAVPSRMNIAIDTKASIQELIGDICGKSHERFRNELIRAQESHIKLIILTEDNGGYCDRKKTIYNKPVTCVRDLFSWKNPRLFIFHGGKQKYPKATKGQTLAKCLITLQEKYGCEFAFTTKENSGAEILRLLGVAEGV